MFPLSKYLESNFISLLRSLAPVWYDEQFHLFANMLEGVEFKLGASTLVLLTHKLAFRNWYEHLWACLISTAVNLMIAHHAIA
jgi:hypothetical protein